MNKKEAAIKKYDSLAGKNDSVIAYDFLADCPVSCKQCFFWYPKENECLLKLTGEGCHYRMPLTRRSLNLDLSRTLTTCHNCPYRDKETNPHKRQPCVDLCTWKYTKWLNAIARYRSMKEKDLIRQRFEQRMTVINESE